MEFSVQMNAGEIFRNNIHSLEMHVKYFIYDISYQVIIS